MAIEHELTAWQQAGTFGERDSALRCDWEHPVSILTAWGQPTRGPIFMR